jgi:FkbM family methyltransferase
MIGAFPGIGFDALATSPQFAGSALGQRFKATPLGFVDVGSLGGIHPVVSPAASVVHALCFEPDEKSFSELEALYANDRRYAGVTLRREALAGESSKARDLYVTSTPTNSSLLEPNPRFVSRYKAHRFTVDHVAKVATRRLDDVLTDEGLAATHFGELIKLDTQGSEFEILVGASRTLRERCVALLCEVEFFQVYKGQRTLSDIDLLLRPLGFSLYGLYPHYRSAKALDVESARVEERLMWADAVFFKDPLDAEDAAPDPRCVDSLILSALLTGFLDLAVELASRYLPQQEQTSLGRLAREIGEAAARRLSAEYGDWSAQIGNSPSYLEIRRFLDSHYHNGSLDFVAR